MNSASNRGSAFLIMIKTGQALPLVATRILRPRMSRGAGTEQPGDSSASRPWQRSVRGLTLATIMAQSRKSPGRERSAIASCPRPQTRQRVVLSRGLDTASTVHEQAVETASACPHSVHDREKSVTVIAPVAATAHRPGATMPLPPRHIHLSVSPPTEFPVHIQFIPAYGLV